jgi:hypothetical protein
VYGFAKSAFGKYVYSKFTDNPKVYLVLFFSFYIVMTNFLISFQAFMAGAAEM